MIESKQFLFIVGAPRSGTTMLQILLGSHPQVATTVELSLFDQYLAPITRHWEMEHRDVQEKRRRRGLPMIWSDEEFSALLQEFLVRTYRKIVSADGPHTHVLDKNPSYSLHVPLIKKLLPQARFIHMLRDGRDVAASLIAASPTMGFGTPDPNAAATLWRTYVQGALEAKQFGPDYCEVRYEEYLERPMDVYQRVLAFCGLDGDPEWISSTLEANTFEKMKTRRATADSGVQTSAAHYRKGTAGNWKSEFDSRQRYEIDRVAGDLLRELGYAGPGWWADTEMERITIPIRWELHRRWRLMGLALSLGRAAITGARLSPSLSYFDR